MSRWESVGYRLGITDVSVGEAKTYDLFHEGQVARIIGARVSVSEFSSLGGVPESKKQQVNILGGQWTVQCNLVVTANEVAAIIPRSDRQDKLILRVFSGQELQERPEKGLVFARVQDGQLTTAILRPLELDHKEEGVGSTPLLRLTRWVKPGYPRENEVVDFTMHPILEAQLPQARFVSGDLLAECLPRDAVIADDDKYTYGPMGQWATPVDVLLLEDKVVVCGYKDGEVLREMTYADLERSPLRLITTVEDDRSVVTELSCTGFATAKAINAIDTGRRQRRGGTSTLI